MAKIVRMLLIVSMLALSAQPNTSFAQGAERTRATGPRKQIATIVFAGLAGAILGLSTLSFYGRPQDKLSNIAIGAGVGIIVGTGYMTYQAATQPKSFYGIQYKLESERVLAMSQLREQPTTYTPRFEYSWNF